MKQTMNHVFTYDSISNFITTRFDPRCSKYVVINLKYICVFVLLIAEHNRMFKIKTGTYAFRARKGPLFLLPFETAYNEYSGLQGLSEFNFKY
jgi:hypothetical protein